MSRKVKRITPAYAGKSIAYTLFSSRTWDHPRLCGEKPLFSATSLIVKGSPPPMRGKETAIIDFCNVIGITPAYAGKRHLWFC